MNRYLSPVTLLLIGFTGLFLACQRSTAPMPVSGDVPNSSLTSDVHSAASARVIADQKFETPEACFKVFQRGLIDDDKLTMFRCSSETSRNYLLGTIAFELERFAHVSDAPKISDACKVTLKKHGLFNRDMMGFLQLVDSPVPGGAPLGFMQIGANIADPVTFLKESLPILQAIAKLDGDANHAESKDANPQPMKPSLVLENVVTHGETAEGTFHSDDQTLPIYFRRENESWVVALAKEEPNWRQPIKGRFMFGETQKKEVDAANDMVQKLLPAFWKAVENPAEGEFAFQLLVEVKTDEGLAKVWCSDIKREESKITGTVQLNEDSRSPEIGSKITFLDEQIRDFHWQRGPKIVGDFIRRVRIRDSESERDQELLKRIIDP